jgi:hypothetical protein
MSPETSCYFPPPKQHNNLHAPYLVSSFASFRLPAIGGRLVPSPRKPSSKPFPPTPFSCHPPFTSPPFGPRPFATSSCARLDGSEGTYLWSEGTYRGSGSTSDALPRRLRSPRSGSTPSSLSICSMRSRCRVERSLGRGGGTLRTNNGTLSLKVVTEEIWPCSMRCGLRAQLVDESGRTQIDDRENVWPSRSGA